MVDEKKNRLFISINLNCSATKTFWLLFHYIFYLTLYRNLLIRLNKKKIASLSIYLSLPKLKLIQYLMNWINSMLYLCFCCHCYMKLIHLTLTIKKYKPSENKFLRYFIFWRILVSYRDYKLYKFSKYHT